MIAEKYKLKNTIKYPTSLIIGGMSKLGLEITDSLVEQGGYVIIVDTFTEDNVKKLDNFPKDSLISFLDYTSIPHLDEDIRRLDYVFYFGHESSDLTNKISTQQFLTFSNYLDATLSLASKFDAKFLLTTSIKAHQLVISSQDVGLNYGLGINAKHTVYTDMEVQKYSESLTMEYVEKAKLDARIIRLGEVMGDGIDFSKSTFFTDLVINAAEGKQLKLSKDGLETEWYIHVLDAAYGIIKAQFSRNTTGQIYSLTYENAISHLALAYKIQEFETTTPEIIFIEGKDNLPDLKLYKPAPNLAVIGWTPKIPFDKAMKQSLASAKIYLLENSKEIRKNKLNLVDKIKGFLAIAEGEQTVQKPYAFDDDQSGPVNRLIAERKRQDELRKKSIEYANDSLKQKKRKRVRTFNEKVKDAFWQFFVKLTNVFSFLKNKSPFEVAVIIILIILAIAVYLFVFSPAIVIGKDFLLAQGEYQDARKNYSSSDFVALSKNINNVKFYIDDSLNALGKYEGFANILNLQNQYTALHKNLIGYSIYLDGLGSISYSLEPFNEYLNAYQNNTQIRTATDSFLSITSSGTDYSTLLQKLVDRSAYFDAGETKMKAALVEINNVNLSYIPSFMADRLVPLNKTLNNIQENNIYLQSSKYLSELLGYPQAQTYLLLVLDNTRETPVGGEVAAFAMLTVKNGSVSEVVVQSPDEVKFNYSSITDRILKEINSRRFTYKTASQVGLNDITSIQDYPLFSETIKKVFEDTYNRGIGGVLTINYFALNNLIQVEAAHGSSVEVNSVKFDDGDFLNHLKQSQTGSESLSAKHTITAQLTANVINNYLNSFRNNFASLFKVVSVSSNSKDLLFFAGDMGYSNYASIQNLDDSQAKVSDSYVIPGINLVDYKLVTPDKYTSVNTATELTVNADLSLTYKMNVKFPNLGAIQEISFCMPVFVLDSAISVEQFPTERTVINTSGSNKCIVLQVINETEATIDWFVPSIGSQVLNNSYSISLSLSKLRGANVTSDYKITAASGLTLSKITPQVSIQDNTAIFTETLLGNQNIELELTRQ